MAPADALPEWAERPGPDEFGDDYGRYVRLVPDGDVLATLERAGAELVSRLRSVPAELERHRYAPGKWTVREVVGHCADTERVFALRALWFARGDTAALPGFEQGDWASASNADARSLAELLDEWRAVRQATVLLFRGLDAAAARRRGVANGVGFTVRAIPWILAGHEAHHRKVLEERYLARPR